MRAGFGQILVVDDDVDFRDLLEEHLVGRGHSVVTASNGLEALGVLAHPAGALVSLVLLDLRMPVMDGFDFLRRLQHLPALTHLPVLVITAEHELREVRTCPSVRALLHKPLDLERLDTLVARQLAPRPSLQAAT